MQRARGGQQDPPPSPFEHHPIKVGAKDARRACGPAAPRLHALPAPVVEQQRAVLKAVSYGEAFGFEEIDCDLTPHGSQIPCDDRVVMRGADAEIFKVGGQCVASRGRHGGSHVVGIFNPDIDHFTDRRPRQAHPRAWASIGTCGYPNKTAAARVAVH